MNLSVDRVVKCCGEDEVDVTFGADTFRIPLVVAEQLAYGLLQASQPADPEVLSELVAHV